MRKAWWWALGGAAAVAVTGAIYQSRGRRRDRERCPAPGEIFDCEGAKLHVTTRGVGEPVVVLEAGIAATSISWALVEPEVARFTSVITYDRAGLGWSGEHPSRRELKRLVQELRAALVCAGVTGRVIVAGHSFGALIARAFAAWHPEQVLSLILLDPVVDEEWAEMPGRTKIMLGYAVMMSRRGAWLARLGVVRLALDLLRGRGQSAAKWIARAASGPGEGTISRLVGEVRKLPEHTWDAVSAHWTDPKNFSGMAAYLEMLPANARVGRGLKLADTLPVTILAASDAPESRVAIWSKMATQLKRAKAGGHWVHLDDPELVVSEIREAVMRARSAEEKTNDLSAR